LCLSEGRRPLCQNKLFIEIVAFSLPGLWSKSRNLVPIEIKDSELCSQSDVPGSNISWKCREVSFRKKKKKTTCDRVFGGTQKTIKIILWVL